MAIICLQKFQHAHWSRTCQFISNSSEIWNWVKLNWLTGGLRKHKKIKTTNRLGWSNNVLFQKKKDHVRKHKQLPKGWEVFGFQRRLWQKRWKVGTGGHEQIHWEFMQEFVRKTGIKLRAGLPSCTGYCYKANSYGERVQTLSYSRQKV